MNDADFDKIREIVHSELRLVFWVLFLMIAVGIGLILVQTSPAHANEWNDGALYSPCPQLTRTKYLVSGTGPSDGLHTYCTGTVVPGPPLGPPVPNSVAQNGKDASLWLNTSGENCVEVYSTSTDRGPLYRPCPSPCPTPHSLGTANHEPIARQGSRKEVYALTSNCPVVHPMFGMKCIDSPDCGPVFIMRREDFRRGSGAIINQYDHGICEGSREPTPSIVGSQVIGGPSHLIGPHVSAKTPLLKKETGK